MSKFRCMVGCLLACVLAQPVAAQATLTNPLLSSGPDPWVITRDGYYYFMCSTGKNLVIRKTRNLAGLAKAEPHVVWTPPASGPYSNDIWAPELHSVRGKWYIYFAADAGTNMTHRIYVLENESADPTLGTWIFKGKVADRTDKWAIDATVFENHGRLYMAWSGWAGDTNGRQDIYLAELENPWTVKSERVRISTSDFPWERIGDRELPRVGGRYPPIDPVEPTHVDVNEGPEVLQHGERLFLTYSANGCWTDFYSLGMLEASTFGDLLKPDTWKKHPQPVLTYSPEAQAYAPGHNSFFQSPDGREDWIIYHANPKPGQGCGGHRSPRAQRFSWNADGRPAFGRPVAIGMPIAAPSGEMQASR
jgi:GH43 family beta-xylosidase